MAEKISENVSVELVSYHSNGLVLPKLVVWRNRTYPVIKIGLHHTYREGRTLYHVFSVVTRTLFMRLVLNTENLHWKLEEISDALPD